MLDVPATVIPHCLPSGTTASSRSAEAPSECKFADRRKPSGRFEVVASDDNSIFLDYDVHAAFIRTAETTGITSLPSLPVMIGASVGIGFKRVIPLAEVERPAIGDAKSAADRVRYRRDRVTGSDLDLLHNLDRIVDLDAKISDGRFNLRMAEQ